MAQKLIYAKLYKSMQNTNSIFWYQRVLKRGDWLFSVILYVKNNYMYVVAWRSEPCSSDVAMYKQYKNSKGWAVV